MNAKDQIQVSSVYDVEESCNEANLFVVFAISLNTSRAKAVASNRSAREVVEPKDELSESEAQDKSQICVKVACTVLCANRCHCWSIKMKTSNKERMEDYTRHGILRERTSVARGRFVPNCGRICGTH